jgi:hypothetical protein
MNQGEIVSSYDKDYQSELDIVFGQIEGNNKLQWLISPLKRYFEIHNNRIAFNLALSVGGDVRTAFAADWLLVTHSLPQNFSSLMEVNKDYLAQRLPEGLTLDEEQQDDLIELAGSTMITHQMRYVYNIANSLVSELTLALPYLHPWINDNTIATILENDFEKNGGNIFSLRTMEQSADLASYGESFLVVGLPLMLGVLDHCYRETSGIDPSSINWGSLEIITRGLSLLREQKMYGAITTLVFRDGLDIQDKVRMFLKYNPQLVETITKIDTVTEQINQAVGALELSINNELDVIQLPEYIKQVLIQTYQWIKAS